ncbi:MAG: ATP-dependent zinc protease [Gemmatimonadetes bacterium]|nr:ATP-dependent zinc protease [Gemmatimonadota bacterium]
MLLEKELSPIGWREWIGLPGLGVTAVKAKVDTGARSSALHAFDVKTFMQDGREYVRFKIHPNQRDTKDTVSAEAPVIDHRSVRSSGGHATVRPVIRTEVTFLGESWPIELTLVGRDEMGFRMLLGRQAVRGRYVVDPGRSFLGGRKKVKRKKKAKAKKRAKAKKKIKRTTKSRNLDPTQRKKST